MVTKILGWSCFGMMLLSAGLAIASIVYRNDPAETGQTLAWFGVLPAIVTSILLAISLLVWSAFDSDSGSDSESDS